MKRTLLDYTQSILSSLNSAEVNSIGDTTESLQVAEILRTTYYNILGRAELPEHDKLFQLTSSGDPTKPTLMYRPNEGVAKLNFVQYFNGNVVGPPVVVPTTVSNSLSVLSGTYAVTREAQILSNTVNPYVPTYEILGF